VLKYAIAKTSRKRKKILYMYKYTDWLPNELVDLIIHVLKVLKSEQHE